MPETGPLPPMRQHLTVIMATWMKAGKAFIRIVVAEAEGSTPREKDAFMLVSPDATAGTIGGGRLEHDAIAAARAMLAAGDASRRETVALGPAIGQCCGGRVTLDYDRPDDALIAEMAARDEAASAARPQVFIYGAGHVGRALALALAPLPFQVTLADGRADELALAHAPGVRLLLSEGLAGLAETAPDGAAHVVMTHSHALDSLIASAVLERGRFGYLGIIGSKTKRASFRRAFREMGLPESSIRQVVCPIGRSRSRDKRPEVIAAFAAAEIADALLAAR
jgi:xanthine dehydrogenase accessory factor